MPVSNERAKGWLKLHGCSDDKNRRDGKLTILSERKEKLHLRPTYLKDRQR